MMYFGTRERMRWVKAPAPGAGFAATGYSTKLDYRNGGAFVRNSNSAHMEYDLTWSSATMEELAEIEDYAYGLHGDGLNYWLPPDAMERNLFSMQWSAPKLTAEDGIPLTGGGRPDVVLLGNGPLGYPIHAAQYEIVAGETARSFHCPIPPGYTAWVGCHGLSNARGLVLSPTMDGVGSGSPTYVPTLGVDSTTRFNASIAASASVNGIDISVDTSVSTLLTLGGLMLQVLPSGVTPALGGFISGRGHSGCIFVGKPRRSVYSVPGGSIGMTANLVEVGDWL